MVMMVLLKEAWTCTKPVGTTFFSFFLKAFFLPALPAFAVVFAGVFAAAFAMVKSLGLLLRSWPKPSSYSPRCRDADPFVCERWCACAAREPASHGDAEVPGRRPFR